MLKMSPEMASVVALAGRIEVPNSQGILANVIDSSQNRQSSYWAILCPTTRVQETTYRIQSPASQDSLRCRLHTPSIPLHIPHNIPPTQLRKHLRNLLDVRGVDAAAARCGAAS